MSKMKNHFKVYNGKNVSVIVRENGSYNNRKGLFQLTGGGESFTLTSSLSTKTYDLTQILFIIAKKD